MNSILKWFPIDQKANTGDLYRNLDYQESQFVQDN